MIQSLKMIFNRLVSTVQTESYRYLYHDFKITGSLIGLIGGRGVGKTTLMLQYIKNNYPDLENVFYFSADHIYFDSISIYAFVEEMVLKEEVDLFFIDEIHKYANWNQELKNLHDGFPSIKIVFSGSSSLDLVKGTYDLSRRAKLYHLPGLSFREYLNLSEGLSIHKLDFESIIKPNKSVTATLAQTPKLLGHFEKYLRQGYYPFYRDDPLNYYEKLLRVIQKTIHEDIANFYNLKTLNLENFGKILNFLASIPPGEININNIGKNLGIDNKTVSDYLGMLKDTGLVEIIHSQAAGNQGLRNPVKIFLNNTNLYYALKEHLSPKLEIGTVRELFFIQSVRNAGCQTFFAKEGDYTVNGVLFEIGGKNKTRKQIKNQKDVFLVQDDILLPSAGTIPLYYFGLLY